VVVSVVVIIVIPSASCSMVSVITSSINSSIVGVQRPIVSVSQSTPLLEKDRNTDIKSHSVKHKLFKFVITLYLFFIYY